MEYILPPIKLEVGDKRGREKLKWLRSIIKRWKRLKSEEKKAEQPGRLIPQYHHDSITVYREERNNKKNGRHPWGPIFSHRF